MRHRVEWSPSPFTYIPSVTWRSDAAHQRTVLPCCHETPPINMARVAVAKLSGPIACDCVVIGIYGFHRDHRNRSMNEGLPLDCTSYAATLKMPTILCGDLNDTTHSSVILGRADRFPMIKASPGGPSILRHDNSVGKGLPIDHIHLNKAATGLSYQARVDYSARLSDHFPLCLSLLLPSSSSPVFSASWASPSREVVLLPPSSIPSFPEERVVSLAYWQQRSVQWLRRATGQKVERKGTFSVKRWQPKPPKSDHVLTRLMALQRLCLEIEKYGVTWDKTWSLYRKARAVATCHHAGDVRHLRALQERVRELVDEYLNRMKDASMREWKAKVVT